MRSSLDDVARGGLQYWVSVGSGAIFGYAVGALLSGLVGRFTGDGNSHQAALTALTLPSGLFVPVLMPRRHFSKTLLAEAIVRMDQGAES